MVDIPASNAAGANLSAAILTQSRAQDIYKSQAMQLIDSVVAVGGAGSATMRSDSVRISPQAHALLAAESCQGG